MRTRFPLATLGAVVASVCVMSSAAFGSPSPGRRAHDPEAVFQHMFERMSGELSLSDAQRAEVEPILRSHFEALRKARESYKEGESEALEQLREQHHSLAQKTEEQLGAILDDGQMERFRELRADWRERARHHRRRHAQGHSSAGPPI